MNSKDFYSKIEGIQKRSESMNNDQLYRELQRFVESHLWRSPLIYGGLYIRQTGPAIVSTFFASKTLEAIEEVCERGTERSEEALMTRKRLDQLLVAMTFLVLAFDGAPLRARVRAVEQDIARKVRHIRKRFVDKVPLSDYLAIVEQRFRGDEGFIQPFGTFFDDLIRRARLDEDPSFKQRATKLKECVELLIEEAGRRIEKPDRVFSCADSLDSISRYAESLFDVGGEVRERFFNKYKWAYPRGQTFDNLNAFWTACMIGLFAFGQALDRSIALAQVSEQAEVEAASTEAEGEEGSVVRVEKASRKGETQQKKPIFRDVGTNLNLKLVVSSHSERM